MPPPSPCAEVLGAPTEFPVMASWASTRLVLPPADWDHNEIPPPKPTVGSWLPVIVEPVTCAVRDAPVFVNIPMPPVPPGPEPTLPWTRQPAASRLTCTLESLYSSMPPAP